MDQPTAPSKETGSSARTGALPGIEQERARLREIWRLVEQNNRSCLSTEMIVCQIYMESRFERDAKAEGSSARGLMQLLTVANRELFRLDNLRKPVGQQQPEAQLYARADAFHASPGFVDEATNIQAGTRYLQALIDKAKREGAPDPIAEAYKDYRGLRNGIYYEKIRAAAAKLKQHPDAVEVLREMTA